jgi:hypothetical protein
MALSLVFVACGSGSTDPGTGTGGTGATSGAGGSGATGGSGGSGGTSGAATYGAVCAEVEQLGCFTGDCESFAQGTLDQAAARGCTTQALEAFQCFADHPPFCDASTGLTEDEQCRPKTQAYLTCLQGTGSCGQHGFLGMCSVLCDITWGAQCTVQPGNSYWSCNCRVGPKVGTTFTLPAIDKCDETLSAEQCAP